MSTTADRDSILARRVAAWKKAGPLLEDIRLSELKNTDTQVVLKRLESCFNWAIRKSTPAPYSGLIEQQRIFSQLRQANK
ncbi:MAG: hypothetical protein D6719_09375 [Candidatus Dadabacteria bacterium]|nr:MAG: hypothetical protein D6719_09375 [Candidatus Dadabacteria bacterium]